MTRDPGEDAAAEVTDLVHSITARPDGLDGVMCRRCRAVASSVMVLARIRCIVAPAVGTP